MRRVGVGVIGCGAVAQIMHLPYLQELADRFRIAAICDLSPKLLEYIGERYGVAARYLDYRDLLADDDVEAVFILSGGSHTAVVIDCLEDGKHVLCEKPLCYSVEEAERIVAAEAESSATVLMGYSVAFDPAFTAGCEHLRTWDRVDYLSAQVLHPLNDLYFAHQGVRSFDDAPGGAQVRAGGVDRENPTVQLVFESLGHELDEASLQAFFTLLNSSIHDAYMLRLLLGEVEEVISVETWRDGRAVAATLRFPDGVRVQYAWIYNHELRHFHQEILAMGGARRMRLQWPSPFLPSAPTALIIDEMQDGDLHERRVTSSYEESFKLEQIHFHDVCTGAAAPLHTVADALTDTRLLVAMAKQAAASRP
jgi:predicted dehydrogenase